MTSPVTSRSVWVSTDFYPPDGDEHLDELLNPQADAAKLLNFERPFRKVKRYYDAVRSIPGHLRDAWLLLLRVLSSWDELRAFVLRVWQTIKHLPVVSFYGYLWRTNKAHFAMNLFVSYALPAILEALPWYFSRRKIGRELRDVRNKIHNQMISGKPFSTNSAKLYVGMTLLYSVLETVDRHFKTRVSVLDRFLIKRLVLERLLYSEVWAVEGFQGGRELEHRIMNDISTTLYFFSFTVPAIASNLFAIFTEAKDLFDRRKRLDWLAIARPFVSSLVWKAVDWVHSEVVGRNMKSALMLVSPQVQSLFSNVLDGLLDVQLNNLQDIQLKYYDTIVEKEFNVLESIRFFSNRIYTGFASRGVFDFLSDVLVADVVMRRRDMDYEQYRKIQIDVNHLFNLFKRTGTYLRAAKRVIERQHRVVELMSLPNFQDEPKRKDIVHVSTFESLVVKDTRFSYHQNGVAPYALNFLGEIKFEPRKIYGIIGQNRSGKSTLMHLICKLYTPQGGSISFNGIPYAEIDRCSLRDIISYVSQKPFIFPGTIRENIMIGNPRASEQELLEAATAAGIFTFEEMLEAAQQTPAAPLLAPTGDAQGKQGMSSAHLAFLANRKSAAVVAATEKHVSVALSAAEDSVKLSLSAQPDGIVASRPAAWVAQQQQSKQQSDLSRQAKTTNNMIAVKFNIQDDNEHERPIAVKFAVRKRKPGPLAPIAVQGSASASVSPVAPSVSSAPISTSTAATAADMKRKRMVLDMVTTARGTNISGGFAQSVALARIFLRKHSKIVILDESMSAMDPIKKNTVIFPNLLKFVKQHGMTLLMISHDMSCLEYVDHVVLLEMGKIVCQGSHEELVARKDFKYLQMLGKTSRF